MVTMAVTVVVVAVRVIVMRVVVVLAHARSLLLVRPAERVGLAASYLQDRADATGTAGSCRHAEPSAGALASIDTDDMIHWQFKTDAADGI
jgi:hypothetical protein